LLIDFHTHIFPEKIAAGTVQFLSEKSKTIPYSDGTISGLLKNMQRAEINFSVILPVATKPSQVEKINNSAALTNEKFFAQGIISFASMHPDFENFRAELGRIKNFGFKGIKIHPVYQDTDLDSEKYLQIFYRAAELDLIVVTHSGLDIGFPGVVRCSPRMAKNVVEQVGEFKFVLAHMGGWKNWDEVLKILAGKKFFLDTSFSTGKIPAQKNFVGDKNLLGAEDFKKFVEVFGAEKILFGTDSPWTSVEDSINFIKKIPLRDEDKLKILGKNAKILLNL